MKYDLRLWNIILKGNIYGVLKISKSRVNMMFFKFFV